MLLKASYECLLVGTLRGICEMARHASGLYLVMSCIVKEPTTSLPHAEILPAPSYTSQYFSSFPDSNEPQTALGKKLDGPAVLLKGPEE